MVARSTCAINPLANASSRTTARAAGLLQPVTHNRTEATASCQKVADMVLNSCMCRKRYYHPDCALLTRTMCIMRNSTCCGSMFHPKPCHCDRSRENVVRSRPYFVELILVKRALPSPVPIVRTPQCSTSVIHGVSLRPWTTASLCIITTVALLPIVGIRSRML